MSCCPDVWKSRGGHVQLLSKELIPIGIGAFFVASLVAVLPSGATQASNLGLISPADRALVTWHQPDAVLIDLVTNGLVPSRTAPVRCLSDMPAFGGSLFSRRIVAVLANIESSWLPEILGL